MTARSDNWQWEAASWPSVRGIRAGSTTRYGGVSCGTYHSLNLALHVGDQEEHVMENRRRLRSYLGLNTEPFWLRQVHGDRIVTMTNRNREADGCFTRDRGQVCAVLTADCLPLLLCNQAGTEIAAVHIGWRGFSRDIIPQALACFSDPPSALLAWLGPCISASHYEVGHEVRDACLSLLPAGEDCFIPTHGNHWLADLRGLASKQLEHQGVSHIYQSSSCTYRDHEMFYSYRREPASGRFASLIWIDPGD